MTCESLDCSDSVSSLGRIFIYDRKSYVAKNGLVVIDQHLQGGGHWALPFVDNLQR